MPTDSFEQFVALGAGRSYANLAAALGCSKRSVTARAGRENWQQRLAAIEAQARAKTEQKLAETTAAINERHLHVVRAMQGKALQALKSLPLGSGMDAIRALDLAIKAERVILGTDGTGGVTGQIVLNVVTGTPGELGEPGQPPREMVERDDLPVLPVVRRLPERGTGG